uniref:Uncharacterized protein n=1 Tax=Anguilla anguilla TaxID=7936 RepID=A0A0E9R1V9_ANGAN
MSFHERVGKFIIDDKMFSSHLTLYEFAHTVQYCIYFLCLVGALQYVWY